MGQKIHPIGLRVGIHRKWNQTWFDSGNAWKNIFFQQKNLEKFFTAFFNKFPYTKASITKRLLVVDLKFYKYNTKTLFLFIFFYKLRTKRRKTTSVINFNKKIVNKSKQKYNTTSVFSLVNDKN